MASSYKERELERGLLIHLRALLLEGVHYCSAGSNNSIVFAVGGRRAFAAIFERRIIIADDERVIADTLASPQRSRFPGKKDEHDGRLLTHFIVRFLMGPLYAVAQPQ